LDRQSTATDNRDSVEVVDLDRIATGGHSARLIRCMADSRSQPPQLQVFEAERTRSIGEMIAMVAIKVDQLRDVTLSEKRCNLAGGEAFFALNQCFET
jgi:hypothetical protein